ncbi:MAG: hypothetical protein HW421_1592 [Ignavibacteria bacterium]|nr:hypothetical protein [Ignavibacteria bacterium]
MFDEKMQIEYWRSMSVEDLETAEILFEKKKYKECLFFCHLSIEKILKAHFCKTQKKEAIKTHNLLYLQKISNIEMSSNQLNHLTLLMRYQLEGRYPEYKPDIPEPDDCKLFIKKSKELLKWLIEKL